MDDNTEVVPGEPSGEADHSIAVLKADRTTMRLRPGALVIEFVRRVHSDFLPSAIGALVNGKMVGLFHPLAEGDHIVIQFARAPRLLPVGLHGMVPREEYRLIDRAFRKTYRPNLEKHGRYWLQRRLIDAGVWPVQDSEELDEFLADALGDASPIKLPEAYQDFGVYDALQRAQPMPYQLQLLECEIERLLLHVFARAVREVARDLIRARYTAHAGISPNVPATIRMCDQCCHALASVVIEYTDRALVCHRADGPCVRRARSKRFVPLDPPAEQYFYIVAGDRSGLVADISAAFEDAEVKVSELLCIAVSSHHAEARVQIESISRTRIAEMRRLLVQIAGVSKVSSPEDPISSAEVTQFPERRSRVPHDAAVPRSPYDVGVLIQRSNHLYGRREELRELCQHIELSLDPTIQSCESLFVHGSFRSGKSSLVSTAFASVKYVRQDTFIGMRLDVAQGDTWRDYSGRLATYIVNEARALGYQLDESVERLPLDQITRAVVGQRRCSVAIAIDEFAWLLHESHANDTQEIARCLDALRNQPGVNLILIGPNFEYKNPPAKLHRVLQTSRAWPVARLTASHCADIVCARNSRHKILADDAVLKRIYQETLGNPYWTQVIADQAWSKVMSSPRSGGDPVRYTRVILDRVLARVARSRLYFAQHYNTAIQEPVTDLTRHILDITMRAVTAHKGKPWKLGLSELAAEFQLRTSHRVTLYEVEAAVSRLETIGTLVRVDMKHNIPTWIMPPILARHLLVTSVLEGISRG